MYFRYMDTKERKILTAVISCLLVIALGFVFWYISTFSYKPGITGFHLKLTVSYTEKKEIVEIQNTTLSVQTVKTGTTGSSMKVYELTEDEVKTFSDYLVRKKRFFLSLDHRMTDDPGENMTYETGMFRDKPYKYEIYVKFNQMERTLVDNAWNRTLRLSDMKNFILETTDRLTAFD